MKTTITFILILFAIVTGYSQSNLNSGQKQGASSFVSTAPVHEFAINKVFPNPVKDFVTLNIHSERHGDLQISLINILGSEVKKWDPISVNPGEQKLELDFSTIKTGVYILKCTKSGQVQTQVVKKN
jgi:hypothetical protein